MFMRPCVYRSPVVVIETKNGDTELRFDDGAKDPVSDAYRRLISDLAAEEGSGEINSFEVNPNAVIGHLSAPGYLDQTDPTIYASENEAWRLLIDEHPECFKWTVTKDDDDILAEIYLDNNGAADALAEDVRELCGSTVRSYENKVVALVTGKEIYTVEKELLDMGFSLAE